MHVYPTRVTGKSTALCSSACVAGTISSRSTTRGSHEQVSIYSNPSATGIGLARFASSGKTAEAFCRDGAVSTATFYGWRARLRVRDGEPEPAPSAATPFIDLGKMAGVVSRAVTKGGRSCLLAPQS
ncbi:IS66 family insertion sequence element accessory protein TnpA [Noviherbaspirillum saxi]|uniref:IS66 family insertion sequence element accessory protein TnpA n=1 Tax=Noviherbaspirillum saxi TaxID=2320863 RepID=UPI003B75BAA1